MISESKNKTRVYVILALIVGVLVGVYGFSGDADSALALKEKCRGEGIKAHERLEKDLGGALWLINPEFTYNKELDTCLYAGGSFGGGEPAQAVSQWWVRDVFRNKDILLYITIGGEAVGGSVCGDGCVSSLAEFEKERERLFGG